MCGPRLPNTCRRTVKRRTKPLTNPNKDTTALSLSYMNWKSLVLFVSDHKTCLLFFGQKAIDVSVTLTAGKKNSFNLP